MNVKEIGEFGLIERLTSLLPAPPSQLVLGVGDDAAVWRTQTGLQVATTDTLVQDIHFRADIATWYELGWKAIAVNISDVAAMGAIPRYALITIGLPRSTEVENAVEMYRGMSDISTRFATALVGGDTVSSPIGTFVGVTLLGDTVSGAPAPGYLARSACRPGDQICVTGSLGASAAGLRMLLAGLDLPTEDARILRAAHMLPSPRVAEGQALLAAGALAAMDISDGLVGDLAKICGASGVGAQLYEEKVPVNPLARRYFPDEALEMALFGGEDYELLFTAPAEVVSRISSQLDKEGLTGCTVIGEAIASDAGRVILIAADGSRRRAHQGGYDHFAP